MDSAKRLHSVKSKKRELRGAQRASRQKIEEIRKVTKFFSLFFNTLHHTLFYLYLLMSGLVLRNL